MSSSRIRAVLVGMGRMGRNHLRVLRESPRFELCAVVDPSPKVDAAAIGVPVYRALADVPPTSFDCAIIATATATHFEVASQLCDLGKHMLVEKPLCSTFALTRELLAHAEAKGVKLAVGHVERFNPAVRKLREVIAQGWLGTPIHFSVTRAGGYPDTLVDGNNVLLDLAVHDIDVVRSIVGPMRVEASVCHSTVKEGVYDTAELLLLAEGGVSVTIHVNWITPTKLRSIRVTGTRGVCFVDYILQTCELMGGRLLEVQAPQSAGFDRLQELYRTTDRIQFGVNKEEPLKAQLEQFYAWITKDEAGELCLGADASRAVLLAERAIKIEADRTSDRAQAARPTGIPNIDDPWV